MKHLFVLSTLFFRTILSISLLSLVSLTTYAQTTAPTFTNTNTTTNTTANPTNPNINRMMHRPCMQIAAQCESAGFRLSKEMPGRNIGQDCVKPILAGQSIPGVKVDSNLVQACKNQKELMMQRREMWKKSHPENKQMNVNTQNMQN